MPFDVDTATHPYLPLASVVPGGDPCLPLPRSLDAQRRSYLEGWCRLGKEDLTGLEFLARARKGSLEIEKAATHDLAFFLAKQDTDAASEWLRVHRQLDPVIWELIATYLVIAKRGEAAVVMLDHAESFDTPHVLEERCDRNLVRARALELDGHSGGWPLALRLTKTTTSDERCHVRASALACTSTLNVITKGSRLATGDRVRRACRAYVSHRPEVAERVMDYAAAIAWPDTNENGPDVWIAEAELAASSPTKIGTEIAVKALENYLVWLTCQDIEAERVSRLVDTLSARVDRATRRTLLQAKVIAFTGASRDQCLTAFGPFPSPDHGSAKKAVNRDRSELP